MKANRAKEELISQEEVRNMFQYLPNEGRLERTKSPTNQHKTTGYLEKGGHRVIEIKGRAFYEHRLVFLYFHGYIPEQIDHINGIRSDNRIDNLRSCTPRENSFNRKKSSSRSSFSSKYRGVSWKKGKTPSSKHWYTYICYEYKVYNIGTFEDELLASKMRDLEVVRRGLDHLMHLNHPHLLETYRTIVSSGIHGTLASAYLERPQDHFSGPVPLEI